MNILLKISKKRHFTTRLECAKSDLKQTWKGLNDLIRKPKTESNYPESTDPEEISNNFNKYFTNIGINLAKSILESSKDFSHYLSGSYMQSFVMYETNEDEVSKLISKINPNKSCGIDLLDPLTISQLSSTLVPILSNTFNKFINTGRVPDKLRKAIIIPAYQFEDRKSLCNCCIVTSCSRV